MRSSASISLWGLELFSLRRLLKSWQSIHVAEADSVKHIAYLSLGSNLGDRAKNLKDAIAALRDAGIRVTRISSMYETEPIDYLDQPWFVNIAVEAETELAPAAVLQTLREIETRLGSKKLIAKGPRLIDMDILLYGDEVIDMPELQVPHPRMHLRRFVLEPLAEIAPQVRHAISGLSVSEMLARTKDTSTVRKM
ncbi:MAG TPA: 2-amino-4-hydroxy-6-hydroxymethyldihydropteridine diphosphokinase [Candidatus Acidoferrum sp.]